MERSRRLLRRRRIWIRWGIFAVSVLFFGSCLVGSYADETDDEDDEEEDPSPGECQIHEHQCGIYMALSTIPGAGLGSFTGVDRRKGDVISDGDVMLPIYDLEYHLQALGPEMARHKDWEYLDPTRDYVWWGPDVLMYRESADPPNHLHGFALGLDAAINCHPALFNAAKKYPSYDFLDLHRHHDPGTGAFTPYHNASSYMTHATPAGAEIFKKYGDDWFLTREETMGLIPLTKDYKTMEALLRHLHDVFEEHELSNETQYDLWNFLVSWSRYSDSRTMMALPKSFDDFQRVIEDGIRAIHLPQSIRTLEDLETNGRCMDHLRPGPSTIRQAGRGAFATRPLAKNSIVTGTPVLFIPTDDVFKLYEGDWFTKNNESFRPDRLKGYQILYNYCWHPEGNMSSIFLCPYGIHVSYINHNRSLANVRVQWASDGAMNHNATLLELSPAAMYLSDAPRLWLDFIATRDIAVGEEIFLDYGAAWEAAWTAHVAAWNREAQYSADYMTADAWNEAYAEAVLPTDEEQKTEPYPGNLRMICLPQIADAAFSEFLKDERCNRAWKPGTEGIPCRIIQRDEVKEEDDGSVSYRYHVLYLSPEEDDDDDKWAESEDWVVREAIRFFDAPYSSDLFLEQAFRHPIGFPDEIFPKAWRGVFLSPLPELGIKAKEKPTKSMVATLLSYLKH